MITPNIDPRSIPNAGNIPNSDFLSSFLLFLFVGSFYFPCKPSIPAPICFFALLAQFHNRLNCWLGICQCVECAKKLFVQIRSIFHQDVFEGLIKNACICVRDVLCSAEQMCACECSSTWVNEYICAYGDDLLLKKTFFPLSYLLLNHCYRYWAVTNVDYIHSRTTGRVSTMISFVWVSAVIVSLAPQFGWKDPQYMQRIEQQKCMVSQDIGYQVSVKSLNLAFVAYECIALIRQL